MRRYARPRMCENCHSFLGYYRSDRTRYGTPLRICPYCGTGYLDRSYVELANIDPEEAENQRVSGCALVLLIAVVGVGIVFLSVGFEGGWMLIGGAVAALIFLLVSHPWRKNVLEDERRLSEQRLSNPEYAWKLQNLGYEVSPRFLDPEKYRNIEAAEAGEKSECAICGIHLRADQFKFYKGILCCNGCYNTLKKHE